jgi:ribosomal protein L6P/L9E
MHELKLLLLKIGFSHLVKVEIPSYIKKIHTSKTSMVIVSNDEILLGDFINKLIAPTQQVVTA